MVAGSILEDALSIAPRAKSGECNLFLVIELTKTLQSEAIHVYIVQARFDIN